MKPEKPYNLFTFFALYIAQTVPMSFFSSALPVLMRQGDYSLTTIALLKLIKLPWIIKVFWSPWIDRNSETVRDYKRWIIISETVYAALILIVAALDLQTHFALMIPLIFLALTASATQDIATDALAARSFERGDKGLLNSMQSIGSFAGSMVGGGFLLLLLRKTGWEILLPWMAVFVLLALLPLYFNKKLKLRRRQTRRRANLKDMYLFFKQKGMPKHILFLFLFYSGIIGILSVLHPLLVDLGYEIEQIGAMVGIFGASCGIVGSFLAGLAIRKAGRKVFRRIIAFFIICTAAYFLAVNSSGAYRKDGFRFYRHRPRMGNLRHGFHHDVHHRHGRRARRPRGYRFYPATRYRAPLLDGLRDDLLGSGRPVRIRRDVFDRIVIRDCFVYLCMALPSLRTEGAAAETVKPAQ